MLWYATFCQQMEGESGKKYQKGRIMQSPYSTSAWTCCFIHVLQFLALLCVRVCAVSPFSRLLVGREGNILEASLNPCRFICLWDFLAVSLTLRASESRQISYFWPIRGLEIVLQGVPWEVLKSVCLWESLKIQNMSCNWCFHFTEIGPFWDLI